MKLILEFLLQRDNDDDDDVHDGDDDDDNDDDNDNDNARREKITQILRWNSYLFALLRQIISYGYSFE